MAKKSPFVVDLLVWIPIQGLLLGLAWMPERMAYGLMSSLGRLFFRLSGRRRGIVRANLEQAFGTDKTSTELLELGRISTGEVFRVLVDVARTPRMMRRKDIAERLDPAGAEEGLVRAEALAPGVPVIICSPHLGSWEAASVIAAQVFGELHIIARPMANRFLQRYMLRTRSLLGQHILPRRGGIQAIRTGLKSGGHAVFLPDQNQRIRGTFVPFFGKLASCDRSPVLLSIMGGHPIVVGAALRVGGGYRFRMVLSQVFLPRVPEEGKREDGLAEGILQLNQAIEALIRQAPEQYFWLHNRFRTRPPETRAAEESA
jgi:Kdo2-lipid IVA lauroyltransferase/acyltransferase